VSALCLAAGGLVVRLALSAFTLAWTHSVERVRWEEDWRIEGTSLVLVEARIQGSGAGMEPPAGAVLEHGFWRYRPAMAPLARLDLARGSPVPDWRLCTGGRCTALADLLPQAARDRDVTLSACPDRRGGLAPKVELASFGVLG
jgi:hypothetical protein